MSWTKIMECVPNFSEGRDLQKIDEIVSPFRAKTGVKNYWIIVTMKTTTGW